MSLVNKIHRVVDVVTLDQIKTVSQVPNNVSGVVFLHLGVDIKLSRIIRELLQCGPSSFAASSVLVRFILGIFLSQVDVFKTS